ncbi:MAG: hypothetical protein ABS52_06035 [Gemmatimonadetes bacterium SCN 70-22]|nr:MAG: hypothetical protein ABS52_06035 [Gemmatimonadetes bacterium SCN 70-22]
MGGRVFTGDPRQPWAEAVAIRGDKIAAVGTSASVGAMAGARSRRIALDGRVVVPGFNDAHVHLGAPLPGVAFQTSDVPVPDPPLEQVLDSLAALVRRTPPGTWLRTGIDAAILDDPRARRAALDSVARAHPVWLAANTGHGVVVNSAGLRALDISDDAPDPVGGFYEREGAPYPGRGQGRLTGLLHEYAAWNAARALRSRQPDSVLVAAFRRHAAHALRHGITSIQNMADALAPFLNLQFAVTHPDNPREGLTMEQAVAAYTRGSAYAEHAERVKGTLALGMLADLAVLSRDIFATPPAELPGTTSVLTIVGGVVVYDALTGRARSGGVR